jgi:hypothetical protein
MMRGFLLLLVGVLTTEAFLIAQPSGVVKTVRLSAVSKDASDISREKLDDYRSHMSLSRQDKSEKDEVRGTNSLFGISCGDSLSIYLVKRNRSTAQTLPTGTAQVIITSFLHGSIYLFPQLLYY